MHKDHTIRKLRKKILPILRLLFLVFFIKSVDAQDIHFSQNFSSPFNLNPALTGDFKGDYRVIGNYRSQWGSVTVPYRTFGLAGDVNNFLSYEPIALGVSVYHDVAGDSRFSTTLFHLNGSFAYPLTSDKSQNLVFGIQPGVVRQDLNTSALNFDNQYNEQTGAYDPSLASGETFSTTGNTWFSLGAGIRWNYIQTERHRVDAGISAYNLTGPPSDKRYISASSENNERYKKRWNFHANYHRKIHEKVDLIPGVIYSVQGNNRKTIAGLSSRYLYSGVAALHLGYWYRPGDAGFATFGVTYQTLYIAVSYDINTSRLSQASGGRGAFEIALIYVFRKFKPNKARYVSCPNYL